jgi:competence CoiA-like predicted nuclease
MKYALVNGIRTEATSKKIGVCPYCLSKVRGNAGKLIANHWKHISKTYCDSWHETETEWHRKWKDIFPKEWQEYIIEKNGKKHVADIYNPNSDLIIEFQNSPLSVDKLKERESFYDRMIWVVNIIPFVKNIKWTRHWYSSFISDAVTPTESKNKKISALTGITETANHICSNRIYNESEAKQRLNDFCSNFEKKIKNNLFDSLWDIMRSDLSHEELIKKTQNVILTVFIGKDEDVSEKNYQDILAKEKFLLTKYKTKFFEPNSDYDSRLYLAWKRQHKHWNYASRPIFFDCGIEFIYMVTDNWKQGNGFIVKRFMRTDFINKYTSY